ncbi:MAG: hypothetical protein AAFX65_11745 [Cyanobacteria bacterium J06638_7]
MVGPVNPQVDRKHIIRVAPLKIGNHVLAWLFARQLSRLIQGHCEIGFRGIPQLGIPAHNQHLLETDYDFVDQDSSYPWPSAEPLANTIIRRVASKFQKPFQQSSTIPQVSLNTCKGKVYCRYQLSTNTPNLYPIRSASVGCNLLLDADSAVCNIGYLPSRCEASSLVPGDAESKAVAKRLVHQVNHNAPNSLYVHIRAGDILDRTNRLYKPLPIKTIRLAKNMLSAPLIFIGQLQDTDYSRALRQAFPDDEFFYSDSEGVDFEIIRSARQALLSTSTFAWLAAWISESNQRVFLPNIGLFNSSEAPEINLIDSQDRRFQYLST